MNVKNLRGVVAAGLALVLGMAVATTALAQARPATAAKTTAAAPLLEKIHEDKNVQCEDCHLKGEKKSEPVPLERCVKCHGDGDPKKLAAKTANVKPTNPHENRHYGVETDCNVCHRIHEPSVNFCAECHPRFDFKVK